MMFQGRSVISAVWGVVPAPGPREQASLPSWMRLRLFRRHSSEPASLAPRLPVAGAQENVPAQRNRP